MLVLLHNGHKAYTIQQCLKFMGLLMDGSGVMRAAMDHFFCQEATS
jgi:hypothetical protein